MEKKTELGFCCVCTRQCPMEVTIEDGRAVSVAPTKREGFPGAPCIRGLSMPEYIYHEDRVLWPLRRTGERGEGKFERISWDEAISEIAEKLNTYKAESGAESVAFYSGYSKWYRTLLQRLAYSFGSINYGTESSSCFRATVLASWLNSGFASVPDVNNAGTLIQWTAANGVAPGMKALREKGMKLIVVEPNYNPGSEAQCDLWLHILPGTDGALAWGLANQIIARGAADEDYIAENCIGWQEYKAYAERFTPEYTADICGITAEEVVRAGELIAENLPLAQQLGNAGMIHHKNGVQNYRAVETLSAITGCFDRKGGNLPNGNIAIEPNIPKGLDALGFFEEKLPKGKMIGADRFPVWAEKIDEFQAMDIPRQVEEGTPYKLRAIFALGMNARMFPNDNRLFAALDKLDFFVDADLFLTDTAKHADIVLPVCSSFERDQFMDVGGMGPGRLWYQKRIVEPVGESISDDELIKRMATALDLDDEPLSGGFEVAYEYMMKDLGLTMDELKAMDKPFEVPTERFAPGERTKNGFNTPSGKYELRSTVVEKYMDRGLKPLPEDVSSLDETGGEEYPMILVAGVRYPHVIHSRTHRVKSLRKLRPFAAVDMNPQDAEKLGMKDGDDVSLVTRIGKIDVRLCVAPKVRVGTVNMYHGYPEADVNSIIADDMNDPYSGFPNFRTVRCKVIKR